MWRGAALLARLHQFHRLDRLIGWEIDNANIYRLLFWLLKARIPAVTTAPAQDNSRGRLPKPGLHDQVGVTVLDEFD
jgi:hypothetical protein